LAVLDPGRQERPWTEFFNSLFEGGWKKVAPLIVRRDKGQVSPEGVRLLRELEDTCRKMAEDLFGRDRRSGSAAARSALNAARRFGETPVGVLRFSRWAEYMARRRERSGDYKEANFFRRFARAAYAVAGDEEGVAVLFDVLEGVVAYV